MTCVFLSFDVKSPPVIFAFLFRNLRYFVCLYGISLQRRRRKNQVNAFNLCIYNVSVDVITDYSNGVMDFFFNLEERKTFQ